MLRLMRHAPCLPCYALCTMRHVFHVLCIVCHVPSILSDTEKYFHSYFDLPPQKPLPLPKYHPYCVLIQFSHTRRTSANAKGVVIPFQHSPMRSSSLATPSSSTDSLSAVLSASLSAVLSAVLSATMSAVLSAVPSILILLISAVLSNSFTHPQHMQRALVRQREHHPKTVLPPLYYTCSNRAGGDASPT